jgi:hypothetical protein
LAMFLSDDVSIKSDRREELLGLRISAVLLVMLGGLFALYVPFFILVLGVAVVRHLHSHVSSSGSPSFFLGLLVGLCIASALSYLCFRAAAGLRDAQRWAAYVAVAFGLLLLLFSGDVIYDYLHPERQSPDEGFVMLAVPFLVAVGLWLCVYMSLPSVRARFEKNGVQ